MSLAAASAGHQSLAAGCLTAGQTLSSWPQGRGADPAALLAEQPHAGAHEGTSLGSPSGASTSEPAAPLRLSALWPLPWAAAAPRPLRPY